MWLRAAAQGHSDRLAFATQPIDRLLFARRPAFDFSENHSRMLAKAAPQRDAFSASARIFITGSRGSAFVQWVSRDSSVERNSRFMADKPFVRTLFHGSNESAFVDIGAVRSGYGLRRSKGALRA